MKKHNSGTWLVVFGVLILGTLLTIGYGVYFAIAVVPQKFPVTPLPDNWRELTVENFLQKPLPVEENKIILLKEETVLQVPETKRKNLLEQIATRHKRVYRTSKFPLVLFAPAFREQAKKSFYYKKPYVYVESNLSEKQQAQLEKYLHSDVVYLHCKTKKKSPYLGTLVCQLHNREEVQVAIFRCQSNYGEIVFPSFDDKGQKKRSQNKKHSDKKTKEKVDKAKKEENSQLKKRTKEVKKHQK